MDRRLQSHSSHASIAGLAVFILFVACVPGSNWMISNIGSACVPNGPCLIPVWPEIFAPSGVLIAGVSFVLRDLVQELLGMKWAFIALLLGGMLSAIIASPVLAAASITAYLIAEAIDMGVFTALRPHGMVRASFISSVLGILLDSTIFVWMAFGSTDYILGQTLGKAWMVLIALPLLVAIRKAIGPRAPALQS